MKEIITDIHINASATKVWDVLINLPSYSKWNPFIIQACGRLKKGERLYITLHTGEKKHKFRPTITEIKSGLYLEWLGHFFIPGLFDGRHYFNLEPIDAVSTRLIQGEIFSGLLAPSILNRKEQDTVTGFRIMNKALKIRAEND